MKNKRQAQVADKICFNSKGDQQALVNKGKYLISLIPDPKVINQILRKHFDYIVYPTPFRIQKVEKQKKRNDLNSNIQYIEKLKLCHFDRDLIANTKNADAQILKQTKVYKNQLHLTNEYQNYSIEYIFNNSLRTIQWTYDTHSHLFNVNNFTEKQLALCDQTGVYQMFKLDNIYYLKHLYQVELVKDSESFHKYSSNHQITQMLYQNILQQLFILTKDHIRTENSILKQFPTNLPDPYIIQQIHLHHNPRALFLQSHRDIQLFDQRKQTLNTLISVDMQDLLTNRIYSMYQFDESQYIMISTNQELQFYDLRNTKCPFSRQKHGCMETGISEFVKMTDQYIDVSKFDGYIHNSNSEKVIGYSDRGNSIIIQFNSGIVRTAYEESSLRTCTNLLYDSSLQYGSDDLLQNGRPMLIGNSLIHSKHLKSRGFQFCHLYDKYVIFSLDIAGGLGLQILDQNLTPLEIINSQFDLQEIMMVECDQNQPIQKLNVYDEIFDDFNDIDSTSIELEEIQEVQQKVKKFKLKNLKLGEYKLIKEAQNDNSFDFEGKILNDSQQLIDTEENSLCKSNNRLTMTYDIKNYLI